MLLLVEGMGNFIYAFCKSKLSLVFPFWKLIVISDERRKLATNCFTHNKVEIVNGLCASTNAKFSPLSDTKY